MNKNQAKTKNRDKQSCLYFQLNKDERDSAIYYLLESILKVRDSDQALAKSNYFDEDVNIYLAHLLFAISLPEYHDMTDPFLSTEPQEIAEWIRQTPDPMLQYFIYKVNADNMLIRSTIFSEKPPELQRIIFRRSQPQEGGSRLAVAYYDKAACCHHGVYQKRTGVGEVLVKISTHFESYQKILHQVRPDYFKFIAEKISPQTYVNLMDQYRPCGKAYKKPPLDRGISQDEYRAALSAAEQVGLLRLDKRDWLGIVNKLRLITTKNTPREVFFYQFMFLTGTISTS